MGQSVEKQKQKKIVYVCFGYAMRSPVIDSQVISWLQRLHEQGLQIQLITFDGIRALRQNRDLLRRRNEKVAQGIGQKPTNFILPFPYHSVSLHLASVILFFYLLPQLLTQKNLLIHSRGEYGVLAARWIKRLFPTVELLYDVRGAVVDEYVYLAESSGDTAEKVNQRAAILREQEGSAVKLADKVSGVSSAMLNYLADFHDLNGKITEVIPCSGDEQLFYFDPTVRARMRRELGVEEKRVLVYSGSLYQWQLLDKMVELIQELQAQSEMSFFFLVLTPDVEHVQKMLVEHFPPDAFFVTKVSNDQVPAYLMASDLGLLLRENHPLNAVASPTKFAEYVMCGLPVVVSAGVGDTEHLVREHKWGVVIEDLCFSKEKIQEIVNCLDDALVGHSAEKIAQESVRVLSKGAVLERAISLYG